LIGRISKVNRQSWRLAILIVCLLLAFTGCSEEAAEIATTEATTENALTDADGFIITSDYVATNRDDVNIRTSPEEESDIYVTLDKGVDLKRTGIKDEWTRVRLNDADYYVLSKYVEVTTISWATEHDADKTTHVVFIDAAKQITEDSDTEALNPDIEADAETEAGMKKKMSASAIGVDSGVFEYTITLAIANELNADLIKRGYTVYMSRTTNNVNLSNAKRAQIANASGAEIYIKISAQETDDSSVSGVLGFITTSTNSHTSALYSENYSLCYELLKSTCEETGAKRLGIYETDNLTSLNYLDIPGTVLNVGFLSNADDDANLNSTEYQEKLAQAIANGIDEYFAED